MSEADKREMLLAFAQLGRATRRLEALGFKIELALEGADKAEK